MKITVEIIWDNYRLLWHEWESRNTTLDPVMARTMFPLSGVTDYHEPENARRLDEALRTGGLHALAGLMFEARVMP